MPQARGSFDGDLELVLGGILVGPAPGVRSEQDGERDNSGSVLSDAWVVGMAQVPSLGAPALEIRGGLVGRVHLCLGDDSDKILRRRARCQGHARVVAHEEAGNGVLAGGRATEVLTRQRVEFCPAGWAHLSHLF